MPRKRAGGQSTLSPIVRSNRAKISFQQKEFGSLQHLCMACYSGDVASTRKLLTTMKTIEDVSHTNNLISLMPNETIEKSFATCYRSWAPGCS